MYRRDFIKNLCTAHVGLFLKIENIKALPFDSHLFLASSGLLAGRHRPQVIGVLSCADPAVALTDQVLNGDQRKAMIEIINNLAIPRSVFMKFGAQSKDELITIIEKMFDKIFITL